MSGCLGVFTFKSRGVSSHVIDMKKSILSSFPKDFKLCCLDTFAKSIIPLLMINTRAEVSRGEVLVFSMLLVLCCSLNIYIHIYIKLWRNQR